MHLYLCFKIEMPEGEQEAILALSEFEEAL